MANGTYMLPAFGDGASYVKLADGTMIQWGFQSATISSGNAYVDVAITYPQAFHASTGNPHVVVSGAAYGAGTSSQQNVCIPTAVNLNTDSKLTSFTLRIWKQASVGTANNPEPMVSWIAIGRWK